MCCYTRLSVLKPVRLVSRRYAAIIVKCHHLLNIANTILLFCRTGFGHFHLTSELVIIIITLHILFKCKRYIGKQ